MARASSEGLIVRPPFSALLNAPISVGTAAAHEIIPAPGAGYRLVIVRWWLNAQGAVYVDFSADGLSPLLDDLLTVSGQVYQDRGTIEAPVWVLPENTPLVVTLLSAVAVRGYVGYFVARV